MPPMVKLFPTMVPGANAGSNLECHAQRSPNKANRHKIHSNFPDTLGWQIPYPQTKKKRVQIEEEENEKCLCPIARTPFLLMVYTIPLLFVATSAMPTGVAFSAHKPTATSLVLIPTAYGAESFMTSRTRRQLI